MNKNVRYSFSILVDALNLKGEYEAILEDSKISVPKNKKHLNTTTAEWCVNNIHVLNRKTKALNKIVDICNKYLVLAENNNNIVFVVE